MITLPRIAGLGQNIFQPKCYPFFVIVVAVQRHISSARSNRQQKHRLAGLLTFHFHSKRFTIKIQIMLSSSIFHCLITSCQTAPCPACLLIIFCAGQARILWVQLPSWRSGGVQSPATRQPLQSQVPGRLPEQQLFVPLWQISSQCAVAA